MTDPGSPRVALVLGAALRADGRPTPALRRRARHAAQLYLSGDVDLIVMSGGVPRGGTSEAEVMRDIALAEGVTGTDILVENQAGNTWENLLFSRPMLPEHAQVVLVTDSYHAPRALMMARRQGLAMSANGPSPADIPIRKRLKGRLREWAATALYLVRGPRRSR
ncbi:YdcF family protein [Aliiroseovarius crassostreae]|uniref:YdcF family protein n=1 Tax=Aliiroseovarius crassostreae TaxID=154981 RepID=UPI003C7CAAD3